jgi:hypothetical protein
MRIPAGILILLFFCLGKGYGQYPYVKKLNYPEQLPTQVVYDMITDSKGYIWLGTDKGLYRFNGRAFAAIPFNNTSSKAVSYVQVDPDGVIWCMNFYNQIFYCNLDTLRRFDIDEKITMQVSTLNNMVVGSEKIWLNSLFNIYQVDKKSRRIEKIMEAPVNHDQVIASAVRNNIFYAFSGAGYLFSQGAQKIGWDSIGLPYSDIKFVTGKESIIGLGVGLERSPPIEINNEKRTLLKPIDLPADVYIFQGIAINTHDYWLCTQNGAYQWNTETGETKCYLPNERVSDVVKDYQGNYWISTLDNGIFICSSLSNTLIKIYNDPLLDNFTKLQSLPNGDILVGNSQGLMSKLNLNDRQVFHYNLAKLRETEFISYDTSSRLIFSNRGIFKPDQKDPIELLDYSKGVERDRFGNLIVSAFSGAYIMNSRYNQPDRNPAIACPLYEKHDGNNTTAYGSHYALSLRQKRSITVLGAINKESFWVAYEDALYEYQYNGNTNILKDAEGQAVIAESLLQLTDGSLVAGTSTKGVMVFQNGRITRTYNEKTGLSSGNVRKVIKQQNYIWVLTDAGLDRINETNGTITNYLEEYGLSNVIINDFIIQNDKLLFATPTGILLRYNVPRYSNFDIKFPLLRATSNGIDISDLATLPDGQRDISFYFEALHYISPASVSYQYRLKGIDTLWHAVSNFNNQLIFNQLSPGKYEFEIQARAGLIYKSSIRRFSFVVPKLYWQKTWFLLLAVISISILAWLMLRQWEMNLLKRQTIKEQLLKSQLVALRAQMNPHFLYNVLNTVQGLVYGNRKAEAGALLGNFSDLMRKTLHASDKQLLPLKDEIENIRLYLELEKARFDERFEYHIGVINIDDLFAIQVPSLLLQPFIENAVKHGLMHKRGMKRVDIKFERTAESLIVTIEDNGIGRQQSMEINQRTKSKPSSFATVAINERMDLFNSLYKRKITYDIIDKTDEQEHPIGTKVVLYIPDYSNDPQAL